MHIHCGLLLLFLSCVRTTKNVYGDELANSASDFKTYSLWPSVHNGATLLRIRRAIPIETGVPGANEGSVVAEKPDDTVPVLQPSPAQPPAVDTNNVLTEKSNSTSQQQTAPKGK